MKFKLVPWSRLCVFWREIRHSCGVRSCVMRHTEVPCREGTILHFLGCRVLVFRAYVWGCIVLWPKKWKPRTLFGLRCPIYIGHFLPKSRKISGSFAKNDMQLKSFNGSLPSCTILEYHTDRHSWHHLECLLVAVFLQKSPIIRGSFAKNDLQLKASWVSSRRSISSWCASVHTHTNIVTNSAAHRLCILTRVRVRHNQEWTVSTTQATPPYARSPVTQ